MAKADSGENPSAQKLGDGLYQFTLLESANYTLSAWEDLTPRRAGHGNADCSPPSRIEAEPVTVSGSDADANSIALTLISPACHKPTQ
jgi:hypothetical protein